ncbi:hypothetical protein O181_023388 [Austropuccinia psidii MF-1]|uniref:Uncharacterized protein n=1 Tax=Austropuccinia psidii MF-1 TaxID=1389203 RepID=A0A9Q3CIP8_9BASI|nr:hypothetical protein [Austropuccinia psidii MF-1]
MENLPTPNQQGVSWKIHQNEVSNLNTAQYRQNPNPGFTKYRPAINTGANTCIDSNNCIGFTNTVSHLKHGFFTHRVMKSPCKINKGFNSNRKFKLLEERAARIRENQATIQAIEEELKKKEDTLIPSGSQRVKQPSTPVASHNSGTRRSVAKRQNSPQSQVLSRRSKGSKFQNKTFFNQSQKESEPVIQKPLDLVKEVHKSQKYLQALIIESEVLLQEILPRFRWNIEF